MSEDVTTYEAGITDPNGKYHQFIQNRDEIEVDEWIKTARETLPDNATIFKYVRVWRCISTTPFIIDSD